MGFINKLSITKLLFLFITLTVCTIGAAYAINWYYSQPKTTTVTENYSVYLADIPETVMQDSTITLTGTVWQGDALADGVTVHIFRNDEEVGVITTDSQGAYSFMYPVSEAITTQLTFVAGVNQNGT